MEGTEIGGCKLCGEPVRALPQLAGEDEGALRVPIEGGCEHAAKAVATLTVKEAG